MSNNRKPADQKFDDLHNQLYQAGLQVRREVVGNAIVDRAQTSSDFSRPLQEFVTEWCWGHYLDTGRTRSQAAIPSQHRYARSSQPVHVGAPSGMEAFQIAEKVISDMIDEGAYTRQVRASIPRGPS